MHTLAADDSGSGSFASFPSERATLLWLEAGSARWNVGYDSSFADAASASPRANVALRPLLSGRVAAAAAVARPERGGRLKRREPAQAARQVGRRRRVLHGTP